jgi:hypothetical protein
MRRLVGRNEPRESKLLVWRTWLVGAVLFSVAFFLNSPILFAEKAPASPQARPSYSNIPAQYGDVIFRSNEKSPHQIFVIGMSHRDSFTRGNGNETAKVQAEVFRIGEWLIHNDGLQLLLPEGFFKNKAAENKEVDKKISVGLQKKSSCEELDKELADFEVLQARLADEATFVNAEILLKASHPVRVQQVEDWALYDAARKKLLKLVTSGKDTCDSSSLPELDYLQERRLAAMVQNIPGVVDDEFRHGTIQGRKAIFTIGMMHVRSIIKYLTENRITVRSPRSKNEDYMARLNLSEENFGATIILPRTLVANREVLKINQLDKLVEQARKTNP